MLLYITFRMDDICPQMNMTKFLEYKSLFDEFGIKPLIGIIPDNQDDILKIDNDHLNFWDMMRQLQADGWTIAQHGYQHVYCSQVASILIQRKLSEFAGLSYEHQVEKISQGKRILSENGIYTDIFMAPGHSYDITTLHALRDCGFKYVTDGTSSLPYMDYGLKFIPSRFMAPLILPGVNTYCIHSNTSTAKDFNHVRKLLNRKKSTCDFRVVQSVSCFNTYICHREEKFYEIVNRWVIIPLSFSKKRVNKWLRITRPTLMKY